MSFLLVDAITKSELGKEVFGIKKITPNERYLFQTENGEKAFVSSFIGETLGQLAAWNVMKALHFKKRPVAGIVSSASPVGYAKVGDTIELHSVIHQLDDEAVLYSSVARVRDQEIFVLENALGPLLPMDTFIDETTVINQFESLFLPNKEENTSPGLTPSFHFDEITLLEPKKKAIATKYISDNDPWFPDHFPSRPVLPLTVLLEYKTRFAFQFLKDSGLSPKRVIRFSQVKMSDFVSPRETIQTELDVMAQSASSVRLRFLTRLHEKKVCTAVLEMEIYPQ